MTSEFTAISKRCSFALEGEAFLEWWEMTQVHAGFFQKRFYSHINKRRDGTPADSLLSTEEKNKVSEYWHIFFELKIA